MPKLQTLKPRLQAAGSRLPVLAPTRPDTVERVRGWRGVQDRERIRKRDGGLCQQCKRDGKVSIGFPVDHIKPLWDQGSDDDDNKETLCQPCHDAKSAYEARERARRGL